MKAKKIILVSSKGGHFAQLQMLEELFLKYDYLLLTEDSKSTRPLKEKYNIDFLRSRSEGKGRGILFFWILIVNFFLTLKIFMKHFPKVIITTGSHTAFPVCILGRILGVKVVYIVSYARVTTPEKTANLLRPFVNKYVVQWPEMKEKYPGSEYLGGIY
ncbi:MAG: PssD/Cps14F family polysaccharide biosynthesis glycosyltransferase [Flavobacteriaceae bacterium]